jgi:acetyltransferase-like isoleucine patch superfamily enzyme
LITTTNHDTRFANMTLRMQSEQGFLDLEGSDDVTVGPASWIGERVTGLPGAHIGAGVVIAARVLKMRAAPDVVAVLVEAQWWTWPSDRVAQSRVLRDRHQQC